MITRNKPLVKNKNDIFLKTRKKTELVIKDLQKDDCTTQSMEDVSPVKWHLGHTSWFFEKILLSQYKKNFKPYNSTYDYIFNSYYESYGDKIPRGNRGFLNRPLLKEVLLYREYITNEVCALIQNLDDNNEFIKLLDIGIAHEEQHQELIFTDIKHILYSNPLKPAFKKRTSNEVLKPEIYTWNPPTTYLSSIKQEKEQIVTVGTTSESFYYDNEAPNHKVYLYPFEMSTTLVNNKEYLEFIQDGGYKNFKLWFADGWDHVQKEKWEHPLYWLKKDGSWFEFTLYGLEKLQLNQPVCHISFYEASAYANWKGKRLPTEFEWETIAKKYTYGLESSHFLEKDEFHPSYNPSSFNFMGNVWEWTSSPYVPYPNFQSYANALGEYNSKFMNNQYVLRGGSCVTPSQHIRFSYRNFFQPEKQWQFTGIRLCNYL